MYKGATLGRNSFKWLLTQKKILLLNEIKTLIFQDQGVWGNIRCITKNDLSYNKFHFLWKESIKHYSAHAEVLNIYIFRYDMISMDRAVSEKIFKQLGKNISRFNPLYLLIKLCTYNISALTNYCHCLLWIENLIKLPLKIYYYYSI